MAWHPTDDKPLFDPMMTQWSPYPGLDVLFAPLWVHCDNKTGPTGFDHECNMTLLLLAQGCLYSVLRINMMVESHDDVIKWKHFPRNWPIVRRIHLSPVNSPHKGQWRWALMFSLICTWINSWVNNPEAGDLRRHRAHCDVSVMESHVGCYSHCYKGVVLLNDRNCRFTMPVVHIWVLKYNKYFTTIELFHDETSNSIGSYNVFTPKNHQLSLKRYRRLVP